MRTGDLQFQIWFKSVLSPAMNVVLRAIYVFRCIWWIFQMELKVVTQHSAPVCILRRGTEANVTAMFSSEAPLFKQIEHVTIWVTKLIGIPTKTESPIVAVTWKCGPATIERVQTAKLTQWILPARGIYEAGTNVPFQMLGTDASRTLAVFRKHMCTALGTGSLECIVES